MHRNTHTTVTANKQLCVRTQNIRCFLNCNLPGFEEDISAWNIINKQVQLLGKKPFRIYAPPPTKCFTEPLTYENLFCATNTQSHGWHVTTTTPGFKVQAKIAVCPQPEHLFLFFSQFKPPFLFKMAYRLAGCELSTAGACHLVN